MARVVRVNRTRGIKKQSSYMLKHIEVDLESPDGNVYAILGLAKDLIRQVEGAEEARKWGKEVFEGNHRESGIHPSEGYEGVLRRVKDKTGITFVTRNQPDLPRDLVTYIGDDDDDY